MKASGPAGWRGESTRMPETPFDNVENAHEYVSLLVEAVRQARVEVAHDVEKAQSEGASRQVEALQLVALKLERLETHLASSRHLLNDLRRLSHLLLGEHAHDRSGEIGFRREGHVAAVGRPSARWERFQRAVKWFGS